MEDLKKSKLLQVKLGRWRQLELVFCRVWQTFLSVVALFDPDSLMAQLALVPVLAVAGLVAVFVVEGFDHWDTYCHHLTIIGMNFKVTYLF